MFAGGIRFAKKHSLGVDLFEITSDTKHEAEVANAVIQSFRITNNLRFYAWEEVYIEKLLKIESILMGGDNE